MKIKQYVRPASLEEAYELNQKKSARILGGMLWMRLGRGMVQTAVDLSGLGLDQIVETQEEFS
ncbi:MAG: FAD binding domain-containing protein, partial [Lachnospiraceae bacterium]|nr:FAD binding domain-containing protein [Lachnospiraceae bacterium]